MSVDHHTFLIKQYEIAMQPPLKAALRAHPIVDDPQRVLATDKNDLEIYYHCFRHQILELVSSGDPNNYVAAMLLTIPIIDRAAQIKLSKRKPPMHECLAWLISLDRYNQEERDQIETLQSSLQELFVNGLKHDAFFREGVTTLTHDEDGKEYLFPVQSVPDSATINVHPIHWCRWIVNRLDFFYIEHVLRLLHIAHEQGYEPGLELAACLSSILTNSFGAARAFFGSEQEN